MKCPICGKEVLLQNKQVGTTENGEPIMNEYAICRDCKKQWNLDKQRAKKMAVKRVQEKRNDAIAAGDMAAAKKVESVKRPTETEQKYGNIPSEKVRAKREMAVKKGYEDMLMADPKSAAAKKKAAAQKAAAQKSAEQKARARRNESTLDYDDNYHEETPKFRALRVVLGIISLIAGAYFVYSGIQTAALTYYVLAGSLIVSGLLLLILQSSNTIFAFLLPMVLYVAGSVFAFLQREDSSTLLYAAIGSAVLGLVFLILTFSSREDEDDDDWEDDEDDDDWGDDYR